MKIMIYRWVISMALLVGCGSYAIIITSSGSALLVGGFFTSDHLFCPDRVRIEVNNIPATVEFDSRCEFVIKNLPTGNVSMLIQVEHLTGTFHLENVGKGELVEVVVLVGSQSLSLSSQRRTPSTPVGILPESIDASSFNIQLPAGIFEQDLTVGGDNFSMISEEEGPLDSCISQAWTTITGKVTINGSNVTFKNIKFLGGLEVRGNTVRLINSCVGENLMIFGNETTLH